MADLVRSDETLVLNRKSYPGLPMLLDREHQVVWHVTEYLRYCAEHLAEKPDTIARKTYALRQFAEHLENTRRDDGVRMDWDMVDDEFLKAWGNSMIEQGQDVDTASYKVGRVVDLYVWAQKRGYFFGIAGVVDSGKGQFFPITLKGGKYDANSGELKGPPRTTISLDADEVAPEKGETPARLEYPSDGDVDAVKDVFIDKANSERASEVADELLERNTLILECAHGPGLRREEIASLKVSQLPPAGYILDCIKDGVMVPIKLVGKGDKERAPQFHPDLLMLLIEFCEDARETILAHAGRAGKDEPEEIFVSNAKGRGTGALTRESVGEIISDAAKDAGVKFTTHSLRKKAFTRMVALERARMKKENDGIVDEETLLVRLQELAGHDDLKTLLKHYIQLEKEKEAKLDRDRTYMESEGIRLLRDQVKRLKGKG